MKISNDIAYIGVNDRKLDLFEGQYDVPNGMAYNSYVVIDEKTAVFDTVDHTVSVCGEEYLYTALRMPVTTTEIREERLFSPFQTFAARGSNLTDSKTNTVS